MENRFGHCEKTVKLYYTDHFPIPLPQGHRFPVSKYSLLHQRFTQNPDPNLELLPAPAASDEQLLLAHTPDYLRRVSLGELDRKEILRMGLPWSAELVLRSRHSVGATIAAARAALEERIAVNMAGGTHHAFADKPEGFCVFNDTIIAARTLQREGRIHRVLVIDTDVHQGNGTASLASTDASIFTFSIHGAKNFPFVKVDSDLDIALPDDTNDADYIAALQVGLHASLRHSEPDLVFFLAGADPFHGDRFSRWAVTKAGLATRDQVVLDACRKKNLPVALSMAGGYARPITDTVDIHESTIRAAAHIAPKPTLSHGL